MKELSITFTTYVTDEADKNFAEELGTAFAHAFDALDPEGNNIHLGFKTEGYSTYVHGWDDLPGEDIWFDQYPDGYIERINPDGSREVVG